MNTTGLMAPTILFVPAHCEDYLCNDRRLATHSKVTYYDVHYYANFEYALVWLHQMIRLPLIAIFI